MAVVHYYKQYTETLSAMLDRFKKEFPEYANEKITYAGRLDPMAEGQIVILTGHDVHRKEEFTSAPKIYEASFVLGFITDTHDVLGCVEKTCQTGAIDEKTVQSHIQALAGEHTLPYPVFSSKTVEGKPLFLWAKEGRLHEIEIPKRNMQVGEISLLHHHTTHKEPFFASVLEAIDLVEGDFRQDKITDSWKNTFDEVSDELQVYTLRARVSSGTYIRSLVHLLGERLGCGACSIQITRTEYIDK
jgi:tRNA pseudouridine55 synthase